MGTPRPGQHNRPASRITRWALMCLWVSFQACNCDEDLQTLPGSVEGTLCSTESGQLLRLHPLEVISTTRSLATRTDENGVYRADNLSAGPLTIRSAENDVERRQEFILEAGAFLQIEDDACAPPPPPPATGTISGCVCDPAEGWKAGANVYVVTSNGSVLTTTSDDAGCFVLENVPVGPQTVHAESGVFYREFVVDVRADENVSIPMPSRCESVVPVVTGNLTGRVCSPDGNTWLAGARVYVEIPPADIVSTLTDADGRYTLSEVPAGEQRVYVEKGSFSTNFNVTIPENDTLTLPDDSCAVELEVDIAVINGQWDDVRTVLLNVGVDDSRITQFQDDWALTLLNNYEMLSQYDIVMFNCGLDEYDFRLDTEGPGVMRDNLRQFVEAGGSVYASDQAYNLVEASFPDYIDFAGTDTSYNDAERGYPMDSVAGTVMDSALSAALGSTSIELHYPLTAWTVMESVAAQVRVFIRADADMEDLGAPNNRRYLSNVPHTVAFQYGQGQVIYTSFHQEPGINLQMEQVLQLLIFEL